jgi:hypothetical protein
MAKPIGKVTHYFGKPRAAVIDLSESLDSGETVMFEHGETRFAQVADSMQIDHEPVKHAEAGVSIGLAVKEPVKPGAVVYRGEEK